MTSVGRERTAVVAIAALLLWGRASDPANVAAAVVAVAFFWWFIGWSHRPRPQPRTERS